MNIAQTPIVNILPADYEAHSKANQTRMAEVMAEVEQAESVSKERAEFEAAVARLRELEASRDALNKRGKLLAERTFIARQRIEDGLLGSAADVTGLVDSYLRDRTESGAVSKVIQRIAEELIPLAFIGKLEADSRLQWVRAAELIRIANERFAKTAELLRSATEFESGIAVDIRTTFSGALLARADELKSLSVALSRDAEHATQHHRKMLADAEARKSNLPRYAVEFY